MCTNRERSRCVALLTLHDGAAIDFARLSAKYVTGLLHSRQPLPALFLNNDQTPAFKSGVLCRSVVVSCKPYSQGGGRAYGFVQSTN